MARTKNAVCHAIENGPFATLLLLGRVRVHEGVAKSNLEWWACRAGRIALRRFRSVVPLLPKPLPDETPALWWIPNLTALLDKTLSAHNQGV